MKRINLYLTEKQLAYFRALSKDSGLSVAELIRRTLDKHFYLARELEKARNKKERL